MRNTNFPPPLVMVIGGMDPSGGAGLCADIQTLSAMGCHAAPIVTAITVQDTQTVSSFRAIEASLVESQMRALLDDLALTVVKTGMLVNKEIISTVATLLAEYPDIRLIVDPVMSSNKDDSLSEGSLTGPLKSLLFPLATVITPNILEATKLAGKDLGPDECAAILSESDCLITGTHADTSDVINRYYFQGSKRREWIWPRLKHEYHGSGCTLASAIAAGIAQGLVLEAALEQAQTFVANCLQAGFKPGNGQHIPDRLCRA